MNIVSCVDCILVPSCTAIINRKDFKDEIVKYSLKYLVDMRSIYTVLMKYLNIKNYNNKINKFYGDKYDLGYFAYIQLIATFDDLKKRNNCILLHKMQCNTICEINKFYKELDKVFKLSNVLLDKACA